MQTGGNVPTKKAGRRQTSSLALMSCQTEAQHWGWGAWSTGLPTPGSSSGTLARGEQKESESESKWCLGRTAGSALDSASNRRHAPHPRMVNGIPRSWVRRAVEGRGEIGARGRELCWRWLGVYLSCSLLIKPVQQQVRGW